ncbi:UNVERIFIED_ORG: putative TIM-barrel fold metal-dependent hydrolase [Burkholderia contaminans]|nr:putative TIM-barrel fold metal-dependent hydrolase [Burkholderia contaminans]
MDIFDGSVLWGKDAWVARNRPDLQHVVGNAELAKYTSEVRQAGCVLRGVLLMPFPSTPTNEYTQSNRDLARAVREFSGNFELKPVYAATPGDKARLDNLVMLNNDVPAVGIKLWPFMGHFHLDDILEDVALVEFVRKNRLPIFMHVGNGREHLVRPAFPNVRATPDVALNCARALPDVPIVIGHVARLCPRTLEAMSSVPNTYLDLSGLTSLGRWQEVGRNGLPVDSGTTLAKLGPVEILRRLVREYGLGNQIIFGSTWPFCAWWGNTFCDDTDLLHHAQLPDPYEKAISRDTLERLLAEAQPNMAKTSC